MHNLICWMCDINKVFKDYKGTELLDSDGNKPCYECYLESEESKQHEEDSECS